MMVRTQISFEPSELEEAKQRAGALGMSLAEFVREAVRKELEAEPPVGDISAIFGMFSGPYVDTGKSIDDEFGDAMVEEYDRQVAEWQRRQGE
jgi:hypothetical protein